MVKKILSKLDQAISHAEEISIGLCLLTVTFLCTLNVIMRYFFRQGIVWSDELVRYLMIYITFIGCSVCIRTDNHISMEVVSLFLKTNHSKQALRAAISFVGVVFSFIMAYFGYLLLTRAMKYPQTSPGLQIPMWIPYLTIPIGFGLMGIRYSQEFFGRLFGKEVFAKYRKKNISMPSGDGGLD